MKKTAIIRLLAISLLIAMVMVATGCAGTQPQEPADSGEEETNLKAEYKLTMNVSNETIWGQGGNKFAELVKEYTDGKVNVKVYPNAMLTGGDQMRQAEMVQSGAIDFMVNSTINIAPTIQEFDAFSLPFLFPTYESVDAATSSAAGEQLLAAMEEYNMVGLAYGENGFREVTNNKHAIKTPDDLKGLKMRVVTPIYIDIMRALGANAVSMNWGEVFTALQQGTIDGQENPIAGVIVPNKIYEVQKYLTNWHYSYDALVVAANKEVWDSFPAEIQDQIKKAAKDAMAWQIELNRESISDGVQLLKDKGVEVTDLSEEELAPFREKTKPVYDKYAEKVGVDIVKAFEEAIEAAK
ncbi:MAG TPA: DctP family TRAP transporter solute-binding subunit [Firmicutes bacterium]|nr:DctP family TRAP transporter solute-binding subunit [Bacillota bacterium]